MNRSVILAAALLLAGCAGAPDAPPPGTPTMPVSTRAESASDPASTAVEPATPTPPPEPEPPVCLAEAEALGLAERAGQLIMVGVDGSLDAAERRAITTGHLGAVILMGNSTRGVGRTATLTDTIQDLTGEVGILIGVDQEGGLVQRLAGSGFDTIPAAADQAKLSASELTERARRWGRQLASAGVHLNLAPVADVVPKDNVGRNEPIAKLRRGYGTDPEKVSADVAAFLAGMHAGGVGTAVKHFPGLGAVRGNTDFTEDVVDSTTTATSPLLAPFAGAVDAGTDAVMVSSATYREIDADRIAAFSPTVIGLLRGWGFDKVVISDDLGVTAALSSVPEAERAARFIAAGGDLALTVDPAVAGEMVSGLVSRAEDDPEFEQRLTESAARVLALKQSYDLAECG